MNVTVLGRWAVAMGVCFTVWVVGCSSSSEGTKGGTASDGGLSDADPGGDAGELRCCAGLSAYGCKNSGDLQTCQEGSVSACTRAPARDQECKDLASGDGGGAGD